MAAGWEREVPVVIMRGGTSKGVFLHGSDLPDVGPSRDAFLLALMGSPDPMQLDGLGGTHSSTSKVMTVWASARPEADVEYLFAQVAVDRPLVDYGGNCGNLTAAVGAFAVDEGLVVAVEPVTVVRLFNTNTGRVILAHVPVRDGRSNPVGDVALAGVPGTGAALVTEHLDPAGAVSGALLPTGRPTDRLAPRVGGPVEASLIDVSSPTLFVDIEQVGLPPDVLPSAINADPALLERLESIRGCGAVLLGRATDEGSAREQSAALPRLALVSAPRPHRLAGDDIDASSHDVIVRALSMQRAHPSCPLTTAMCLAAATTVPGSIPARLAGLRQGGRVRIAHPQGIVVIDVSLTDGPHPTVRSVSVVRTARRLLAGTAHVSQPAR